MQHVRFGHHRDANLPIQSLDAINAARSAFLLGKDEAVILQTIALLQKTHSGAALRMLSEWLPGPAVSGVLKLIRWFAIDLLDAGVELDVQARRVTYMH